MGTRCISALIDVANEAEGSLSARNFLVLRKGVVRTLGLLLSRNLGQCWTLPKY